MYEYSSRVRYDLLGKISHHSNIGHDRQGLSCPGYVSTVVKKSEDYFLPILYKSLRYGRDKGLHPLIFIDISEHIRQHRERVCVWGDQTKKNGKRKESGAGEDTPHTHNITCLQRLPFTSLFTPMTNAP